MTALDCPVCCAPFKEIVKDGVLIDICTECRGVWLDCGELDKLLNIAREKNQHQASRRFEDGGFYIQGNTRKN